MSAARIYNVTETTDAAGVVTQSLTPVVQTSSLSALVTAMFAPLMGTTVATGWYAQVGELLKGVGYMAIASRVTRSRVAGNLEPIASVLF